MSQACSSFIAKQNGLADRMQLSARDLLQSPLLRWGFCSLAFGGWGWRGGEQFAEDREIAADGFGRLAFHRTITFHHAASEVGNLRTAAAAAAGAGDNQWFDERGISGFDQGPGAAIRHIHFAAGGGDGTRAFDRINQVGPARPHGGQFTHQYAYTWLRGAGFLWLAFRHGWGSLMDARIFAQIGLKLQFFVDLSSRAKQARDIVRRLAQDRQNVVYTGCRHARQCGGDGNRGDSSAGGVS